MRLASPPSLTRLALLPVLALLSILALPPLFPCAPALGADPASAAADPGSGPADSAPAAVARGRNVDLNGRVAAGLDKTLIKDHTQGYFVVEGEDLSRFAGRSIQARGVVVGQEQGYPVVRLLEYSITSPDDESPGASAHKDR